MAFQNAEAIQKLYVAFFNRPADYYGLQYWDNVIAQSGNASAVISSLAATFAQSKEYTDTYAGQNTRQIINNIYKNLFGRPAEEAGLEYWNAEVTAGRVTLSNAVLMISGGAQNADKIAYASKVTAATAFTDALDTTDERLGYAGEKANAVAKQFIAGVTDAATLANAINPANLDATVNESIGAGQNAQTVLLTKGLDNVPGGAGNDLIIGAIDTATTGTELNTLSSVDIINGGAGVDTLKIQHVSGDVTLGSLSNVEIVTIESAATGGVTVDTTTTTGVTQLNVTKSAGSVDLTAGNATDITLAAREGGGAGTALAHQVNGGKNVTVNATAMGNATAADADTITVGATTAAKGNVVVNAVGKAYDAAAGNLSMGDITVTGGATITVNQTAAVSTGGIGADDTAGTVSLGAVDITTDTATTTVVVKQTANVAAVNGEAGEVGGVNEVATVKFNALKNGDSIALNGLTFTAKADMTAAEVAAAFSSLVKNTLPVTGDTQSAGVYTKGTYTGVFNTAKWTSGAATGDTVVFTAVDENTNVTDLNDASLFTFTKAGSNTTTAPTFTIVQGVEVTAGAISGGVMGVATGVVTIDAGTANVLKTVTVDGYTSAGSAITGIGSTKLDTVNLLNGGNFAIDTAAETLSLNLTNIIHTAAVEDDEDTVADETADAIAATIDLNATATKTLNVTSNGDNLADLDLSGASAAATLNVAGNGLLTATGSTLGASLKAIKVSGSAGLDLGTTTRGDVTSVDTTGTTGTVTIAINGTSTYAGGAGKDIVTIANANVAIGKSVDLGAGDDTLNLTNAGTILVPTVDLKGGEGRDTLKMSAANAVALSAAATFGGKFDGFEVLSLDKATVAGTVNLSNLDNINYVISRGSDSVTGSNTPATFSVTINNGATAGDKVTFGGADVFTAGGTLTAAQLAAQLAAASYAGYTVTGFNGTTITFQSVATGAGATAPTSAANPFAFVDADTSGSVPTFTLGSQVNGTTAGPAAAALTIGNLASAGTVELTAGSTGGVIVNVKDAATGTADVLNIVAKATGLGTVTANNVETINVEAAASSSLTVAGNSSLTAINVTGTKALNLSVASTDVNLAAINGSTATGALTVNLSAHNGVAVTVTGGSAADILTASQGANAHADVLIGGAGTDTLTAGSNGARLTGGAGNDLFILQAGNKEANTYSAITDFSAGDLLKLNTNAGAAVASFAKLTATLDPSTSVFSNYVDAAIAQTGNGAVWFTFNGNSYVVIDNGTDGGAWETNADAIIQLTGVATLDNVSYNVTHGTIGLI